MGRAQARLESEGQDPYGNSMSRIGWIPKREARSVRRHLVGSRDEPERGHIYKYVFNVPIKAIFVNSPKVI